MRDDLNHRFLVEDEKYASNNSVERSNNVSWNKTIHALSIDLGDISIVRNRFKFGGDIDRFEDTIVFVSARRGGDCFFTQVHIVSG